MRSLFKFRMALAENSGGGGGGGSSDCVAMVCVFEDLWVLLDCIYRMFVICCMRERFSFIYLITYWEFG